MATGERDATALLDETTVLAHLHARGLLEEGVQARVTSLGGGVSNVVLRVTVADLDVVVKQALPRLRVEAEWRADPRRTLTEGRAMRLAAARDADFVPTVVDLDEQRAVLVIAAAPPQATDWKQRLLHGDVDEAIATRCGTKLARVHCGTLLERLTSYDRGVFAADRAFHELRVAPYLESAAQRHPHLERQLLPLEAAMRARRACLVHGDASPKNLLVGGGVFWLIDWEVAHLGDPAFDVAFLCTHLALKAIHVGPPRRFLQAASAFLAAYAAAGGPAPDDAHAARLLGALLLARVDGRSPAEYLDEPERRHVRLLATELLVHPRPSLGEALRTAG